MQVFSTIDRQCLHVIYFFFFSFCSQPAGYLEVALGKQNLQKRENQEQIFDVEKIIIHNKYREKNDIPHNDIGKFLLLNIHMAPLQPQLFEAPLSNQSQCKIPIENIFWK